MIGVGRSGKIPSGLRGALVEADLPALPRIPGSKAIAFDANILGPWFPSSLDYTRFLLSPRNRVPFLLFFSETREGIYLKILQREGEVRDRGTEVENFIRPRCSGAAVDSWRQIRFLAS